MDRIFILLLISPLLFSCTLISHDTEYTLVFEDRSPWDAARGIESWYLLRWQDPRQGVRERYIEAGTEKTVITLEKGAAVICCAYPLGSGTPMGAVVNPEEWFASPGERNISLCYAQGAAAELLIKADSVFPGFSEGINSGVFLERMEEAGEGESWRVDRNTFFEHMGTDIASIGNDSFTALPCYPLEMFSVPEGLWIPDTPLREPFRVHTEGRISIDGFYEGTFRYLQPEELLVMTVIGGEAEAYWFFNRIPPAPE